MKGTNEIKIRANRGQGADDLDLELPIDGLDANEESQERFAIQTFPSQSSTRPGVERLGETLQTGHQQKNLR